MDERHRKRALREARKAELLARLGHVKGIGVRGSSNSNNNINKMKIEKDIPISTKEDNSTAGDADKETGILAELGSRRVLKSVHDRGAEEHLSQYWQPPSWSSSLKAQHYQALVRHVLGIRVEGQDIPPLLTSFETMRIPRQLLSALSLEGIQWPQPIQMQCIPAVLARRNVIGIAETGGGKTLGFGLGTVLWAHACETRQHCRPGEGPFALVLLPTKDLAGQTHATLSRWAAALSPCIHVLLAIGGVEVGTVLEEHAKHGCHILVGTPGRIKHLLETRTMTGEGRGGMHLMQCEMLVLDEADKFLDSSFVNDVRTIINYIHRAHQTVLFSATMPSMAKFSLGSLNNPVIVRAGDGGVATANVTQEFFFVMSDNDVSNTKRASLAALAQVLFKTEPPTIIFASSNGDVELIQKFLNDRGVGACMVHGDMDQKTRLENVSLFREKQTDVLVASDVASKGLDFPGVKHVINFDVPKVITDYIHRIGRTGRRQRGLATTLITNDARPTVLLDIRALLIVSKQRVPPPFENLAQNAPPAPLIPCPLCQGMGHTVEYCPSLKIKKADALARVRESIELEGL